MKPRFLVADHDEGFAEAVRRSLISRGYVAEKATDGLRCIQQVQRMSPDVLVLDSSLDGEGGLGVMKRIHHDLRSGPTVFAVCDDDSYSVPEDLFWETDFLIRRPRTSAELQPYINQLEILGSLNCQKFDSTKSAERQATP